MIGAINTLVDGLKSLYDTYETYDTESGITFISGEHDEDFLSYAELYRRAKCLLFAFQQYGLKPGDELIFQFQSNKKFIISFWACLLGKIIPVPLAFGGNETLLKVINVWKILNNPHVITDSPDFNRALKTLEDTLSKQIENRTITFD
ncbi:MAG: hypothetical protein MUF15_21405, partial [Acidobacteria bacterium]|nr:hypothetical protein [Acidobacteriota bacterium]